MVKEWGGRGQERKGEREGGASEVGCAGGRRRCSKGGRDDRKNRNKRNADLGVASKKTRFDVNREEQME